MNFIEELRWRGMLHDMTPGAEEYLSDKKITGYIGFDPTAPSMTIGNFVQLMILKLFQLSGHKPIVLMGGATGRIGDPSFKENERDLKSYEELDKNLSFQMEQVKKLLEFEGDNAALIVNNLDFYKNMNVLDFLRDVGKTLTVNYMMSKDSVKNRLETGLSFTEFSYQLLQAYDFQLLHEKYNCHLQMGGSDQWGNITSGTEFIRRNTEGKAYAVTTPLLTKADGSKFGKSEQGNIWLDPDMTSPYQFYQFWINSDDKDISKYLRYFSLKSHEDIEALEAMIATDPRAVKAALAEELTSRIHSQEKTLDIIRDTAKSRSDITKLTSVEFENLTDSIPTLKLRRIMVTHGKLPIYDFIFVGILQEVFGFKSKSDLRRAIEEKSFL
ncbi:MAG: tyrosine--tRNA ligase [Saprospiraceae bacterium]|nr:tyrosine--tRNA ligase [Saprospiraceae bacterium]